MKTILLVAGCLISFVHSSLAGGPLMFEGTDEAVLGSYKESLVEYVHLNVDCDIEKEFLYTITNNASFSGTGGEIFGLC